LSKREVVKQIAILVAFSLVLGTWLYVADRAWGAAPTSTAAAPVLAKCAEEDGSDCVQRIAKRKVRQFKAGKLGDSEGVRLPKKVRKMIARKAAAKGIVARADDGEW